VDWNDEAAEEVMFDYTKKEWLEWANSMEWDRREWMEYADSSDWTDEEWGQWFELMEWDEEDLDKFLDRQERRWGGDDDEADEQDWIDEADDWIDDPVDEEMFDYTKEEWLEWANSM